MNEGKATEVKSVKVLDSEEEGGVDETTGGLVVIALLVV